nr:immunoglobulin heavy chain junction region [Macaca mulatta]MOW98183.1 immunoglobulin heavy chain junction region [Macaca mulatta]MOW98253.1 immunoglobulin heavy chain junction region [Macaca mulatta]MOW98312.1 immunoglobulin heavy chain junction region [Macaca mulatta]MOW98477.1 immunoglobulin heavy chain junction region [Macaca mulatta]
CARFNYNSLDVW